MKYLFFILLLSQFSLAGDNLSYVNYKRTPVRDAIELDRSCFSSMMFTSYNGIELAKSNYKIDREKSCYGDNASELEEVVTRFSVTNTGSKKINPLGNTERQAVREYSFEFEEEARQQIKMDIFENAKHDGRISHWSMHSAVYFIPRKIIPYIEVNQQENKITVHLPTEETVDFRLSDREIIGGVISELPIDASENRHARKFPQINYSGNGYMIRIDQRGELPEADLVWGVKKYATITKGSKSCRVRAYKLWDQGDGDGSRYLFKFPTDEEFYTFMKKECGF